MDIIIIVLITAMIIWKSLYTVGLIREFSKKNDNKNKWINIIFLGNYIIYFYFLFKAAMGLLNSPLDEPLLLIIIFVVLVLMNVYYDLKSCKFRD